MAESNLQLNKIWFDAVAATDAIQKICREKLEDCADEFAEIIKEEIEINGNGSHDMRNWAKSAVKKELSEMSLNSIIYDVGIDESKLGSAS